MIYPPELEAIKETALSLEYTELLQCAVLLMHNHTEDTSAFDIFFLAHHILQPHYTALINEISINPEDANIGYSGAITTHISPHSLQNHLDIVLQAPNLQPFRTLTRVVKALSAHNITGLSNDPLLVSQQFLPYFIQTSQEILANTMMSNKIKVPHIFSLLCKLHAARTHILDTLFVECSEVHFKTENTKLKRLTFDILCSLNTMYEVKTQLINLLSTLTRIMLPAI